MKSITQKEFNEAPKLIQSIYIMAISKMPISLTTYQEALEKYPSYFTRSKKVKNNKDLNYLKNLIDEIKMQDESKTAEGLISLIIEKTK